jgi:hypothetical protein
LLCGSSMGWLSVWCVGFGVGWWVG